MAYNVIMLTAIPIYRFGTNPPYSYNQGSYHGLLLTEVGWKFDQNVLYKVGDHILRGLAFSRRLVRGQRGSHSVTIQPLAVIT